jgi:SsrA-binding protein
MSEAPSRKLISTNSQARQNYHWDEVVEAGIALTGTEVKSIRQTAPSLKECYVEVRSKGARAAEAWLLNLHLVPYSHGNIWNHEPRHPRKLLLHRRQIERLMGALTREGLTVIPTQMYFVRGRVKLELALGAGKKKSDKRQDLKKKDSDREMARAMRNRR